MKNNTFEPATLPANFAAQLAKVCEPKISVYCELCNAESWGEREQLEKEGWAIRTGERGYAFCKYHSQQI